MISPLGPRGDVGVSRPATHQPLDALPILLDVAKTDGPQACRTHSDGTRWIDAGRPLSGRKTENKNRRALRAAK